MNGKTKGKLLHDKHFTVHLTQSPKNHQKKKFRPAIHEAGVTLTGDSESRTK